MRFYEKLFQPIPIIVLTVGFIIVNPLHIPPDAPANAQEIVVPEPVLVERTPSAAQEYAKALLPEWGWGVNQWECLLSLWTRESNWRPNAYNKTPVYQNGEKLHAGGIPQILGLDPLLTVERQIERGFTYLESRYGSPCTAWRFWQSNYWY